MEQKYNFNFHVNLLIFFYIYRSTFHYIKHCKKKMNLSQKHLKFKCPGPGWEALGTTWSPGAPSEHQAALLGWAGMEPGRGCPEPGGLLLGGSRSRLDVGLGPQLGVALLGQGWDQMAPRGPFPPHPLCGLFPVLYYSSTHPEVTCTHTLLICHFTAERDTAKQWMESVHAFQEFYSTRDFCLAVWAQIIQVTIAPKTISQQWTRKYLYTDTASETTS